MKNIKPKPWEKDHLPWLNSVIQSVLKKRDHALKMAPETKVVHIRQIFTSLGNKVNEKIRNAKANFFLIVIKYCETQC